MNHEPADKYLYRNPMVRSRGAGQGVRTPLKKHKHIGFHRKTVPDPLKKAQGYQASILYRAIIDTPGKRRWRADVGPHIVVFGSSLVSLTKKNVVKFGPPLANFSGSAHESHEQQEQLDIGYISKEINYHTNHCALHLPH